MLCNLIYMHLRNRQEHGEKCTEKACGNGCGFLALESWLNAPVTAADHRADARRADRVAALMRGEIPT